MISCLTAHIWASATPIPSPIIELKMEKAAALAQGDEQYDALIDEFQIFLQMVTMFQYGVNLRKEILMSIVDYLDINKVLN